MRKDKEPNTERIDENEASDDSGEWTDDYPSETIMAVPANDMTAGVKVTRYDMESAGQPPILEITQWYPPEDDIDGVSVYVHGEHAAMQLIAAIAELASGRFDDYPWDDDE